MRTTQRKGDTAVAKAIARFTELGFDVSKPLTESAKYDLIVDDGSLHRVQVKYCSNFPCDVRNVHSNSNGYVVKKTKENDYDWLLIYRPTGEIYLIKYCLINRNSVTPKETEIF